MPALTSNDLLEEAHKALGYGLTSSTSSPSPRDDSIKALWRSSSAANLTDIPDLPTPSPDRPSPRRMQSAPDLRAIIKASPCTPIRRKPARGRVFELSPAFAKDEDESCGVLVETGLERLGVLSPSNWAQARASDSSERRTARVIDPTPARALTEVMRENIVGLAGCKRTAEEATSGQLRKRIKSRPLSLRTRIKIACRFWSSRKTSAD